MTIVQTDYPNGIILIIDRVKVEQGFKNRSDALRFLIKEFNKLYEYKNFKEELNNG